MIREGEMLRLFVKRGDMRPDRYAFRGIKILLVKEWDAQCNLNLFQMVVECCLGDGSNVHCYMVAKLQCRGHGSSSATCSQQDVNSSHGTLTGIYMYSTVYCDVCK